MPLNDYVIESQSFGEAPLDTKAASPPAPAGTSLIDDITSGAFLRGNQLNRWPLFLAIGIVAGIGYYLWKK